MEANNVVDELGKMIGKKVNFTSLPKQRISKTICDIDNMYLMVILFCIMFEIYI